LPDLKIFGVEVGWGFVALRLVSTGIVFFRSGDLLGGERRVGVEWKMNCAQDKSHNGKAADHALEGR
jgi:hypothetical protein